MPIVLALLRPKQWIKNVFVLAPLFFSLGFVNIGQWQVALLAVLAFILGSGAVYIYNDVHDVEYDRAHPKRRQRPIASGRISIELALMIAPILAIAAVSVSLLLPARCATILMIYVLLNLAYTHGLKHQVVLDVIIIALGFVLRVFMGGYAIEVPLSPWIIITTFCLALFLGFSKRYGEYRLYQGSEVTRKNLADYNQEMLRSFMNISCVTALIAYIIYTLDLVQTGLPIELVYTTVFVVYGLFRYLFLLYRRESDEPEVMILSDPLLIITGMLWLATTMALRLL